MATKELALHEKLEIHELLIFKTSCVTKAVRSYAVALTEAASPKVRKVLKSQLDTAIKTHQKIADYMIENEMYHPYDIDEQVEHDMKKSEIARNLVENK